MSDLASEANRFRVRFLDETPSTNDEVKRALEAGESEGLVVRARRQVAGYGRQGRAWTSPEGGLYCSLLLRPQVEPVVLPTLSLVAGIAVRRAIVALVGASAGEVVKIKWPNDVVVVQGRNDAFGRVAEHDRCTRFLQQGQKHDQSENRVQRPCSAAGGYAAVPWGSSTLVPAKLCGISLEAHRGGVCVGVGVNVLSSDERPDVGGKNRPAYVADFIAEQTPSVEAALNAFLAAFAPLYDQWMRDGFSPFVSEFNAHSSLVGREVSVVDRAGAIFAGGVVQRVDYQGRLVVRDALGAEVPISSGEAHLV